MKENNLKIEYLRTGSLTPYEKNARKHTDEDLETIIQSIEQFGFDDPIGIWSEKNIVVEGHGRLIAAKRLGIKEVPCIRLDHLSDEERKAYALAHNKTAEMSDWDFDLLEEELRALGGSGYDMTAFGFEIGDTEDMDAEEDDYEPEIPEQPRTKLGDIYKLGEHRLICGDSTKPETLGDLMEGKLASLMITDPPYNVSLGMSNGKALSKEEAKILHRRTDGLIIQNDEWKNEAEFIDFLTAAFSTSLQFLKAGGVYYIWFASYQSLNFRIAAQRSGLTIRQELIWVKSIFSFGRQDYQWQHEPCLYGWKDGAGHYFVDDRTISTIFEEKPDLKNMKRQELQELLEKFYDGTVPTTVIREDKPTSSKLHPTMKPIRLISRQIRNSSKKGELVLDIFGGSGSTLIAAEQLGRKCNIVELDPKFCDVIIDRFERFTGKEAEKIK